MKTITITFPGISLNQVREQNKDLFYDQSWYTDEAFANENIPAGVWEVSLEPLEGSFSKTWEEQQELLPEGYEVPPAAVLAYALVEYFKKTGERCLSQMWVRTGSRDSGGDRVYVGRFGEAGLLVDGYWDGYRDDDLGLLSARKVAARALEDLGPIESSPLESLPQVLEINGVKYRKES